MPTDTERIDELEAQIALLKSTVKQLLQIIHRTGIELDRNYHGDIIDAKLDWDKADLYELKKPLN